MCTLQNLRGGLAPIPRPKIFTHGQSPSPSQARTLVWNEDMKGGAIDLGRWPVEELWDAYHDKADTYLIIPHVGGRRCIADWHHPELERLVEIASSWGTFPGSTRM